MQKFCGLAASPHTLYQRCSWRAHVDFCEPKTKRLSRPVESSANDHRCARMKEHKTQRQQSSTVTIAHCLFSRTILGDSFQLLPFMTMGLGLSFLLRTSFSIVVVLQSAVLLRGADPFVFDAIVHKLERDMNEMKATGFLYEPRRRTVPNRVTKHGQSHPRSNARTNLSIS